ncbi:MAG TPA: NAD(P)/FAD-dependent oxidoreductase, partial [Acidisoma sp.]|uniref:NAD(P)/FAD-dependent oxidoreductase n=1 Tax=Acidisoma sp. TaxID=1872115 RepID=UPI002C647BF3
MQRESMEFDTVIVGAGPAGLAAAIRLKQLEPDASVCVVEKGSEVGAHILSGAVIEPRALEELLPNWRELDAPLTTEAKEDRFYFLTEESAFRLPTPPQMHNRGNYIVSLGDVVRWLGAQAEALGVEIYPGFAAAELLEEEGRIVGIATGDMGVDRSGAHGPNYQPGMELRAPYTLFAEGCRGSLSKQLMARFDLRNGVDPQTYGLGIKELWEIPEANHRKGLIEHSFGWPMDNETYGGSWLYHLGDNLVSYGFVIGLDYKNTWISPFEEMQRLKTHPHLRKHFEGGRRIAYGARALSEGGLQSIPRLTFPGGALLGDAAGFLNVPKIKGTHAAMKSGMMAAEAVAEARAASAAEPTAFTDKLRASWLHSELSAVRNIRPSFAKFGNFGGFLYSAVDTMIFRGKAPWTFHHPHADNEVLEPAREDDKIAYPKPDGVLTFDRLSSVFISNTNHEE